jgi:hypothetical protein
VTKPVLTIPALTAGTSPGIGGGDSGGPDTLNAPSRNHSAPVQRGVDPINARFSTGLSGFSGLARSISRESRAPCLGHGWWTGSTPGSCVWFPLSRTRPWIPGSVSGLPGQRAVGVEGSGLGSAQARLLLKHGISLTSIPDFSPVYSYLALISRFYSVIHFEFIPSSILTTASVLAFSACLLCHHGYLSRQRLCPAWSPGLETGKLCSFWTSRIT